LFEKHGINHFSVFSYSEALRVYQSLRQPQTIVIMGWIPEALSRLSAVMVMSIKQYFRISKVMKFRIVV
jgi:alanine racemase